MIFSVKSFHLVPKRAFRLQFIRYLHLSCVNYSKCNHTIYSNNVHRYAILSKWICQINGCVQLNKLSRLKNRSILNYRTFSTESLFCVDDYDCVGFDLDNTICEYNLNNSVRHEYNVLAEHLVDNLGYDGNALLKPLLSSDVDFLQKGLIIDTNRGNFLRIRKDGYIFKASHGFSFLTDEEIVNSYGPERKWVVTTDFAHNPVAAWNGPLAEQLRTLADYFDMPASIVLSRCIDSKIGLGGSIDFYRIWKDVLNGLVYAYDRTAYAKNQGYFKHDFKNNPELYLNKCTPEVIDWLKEVKRHKKTFLITGSYVDNASHTANFCLGGDWQEFFDVIICYARKPGFFVGNRPFVRLDNFKEAGPIQNYEIKIGEIYSQGNWQGLYNLLASASNIDKPKCLYIGDNLIQDIFTVSEFTCCDTVTVSEELSAEYLDHTHKNFLLSDSWGSYFTDGSFVESLWCEVIKHHSKICVPSLNVLAAKPLGYKFSTFSSSASGFHSLKSSLDLNVLTERKNQGIT